MQDVVFAGLESLELVVDELRDVQVGGFGAGGVALGVGNLVGGTRSGTETGLGGVLPRLNSQERLLSCGRIERESRYNTITPMVRC